MRQPHAVIGEHGAHLGAEVAHLKREHRPARNLERGELHLIQ